MDKIESAGASILWNLSDEDNVNNTFEWCLEKKRVDIVVSLDNDRTEQAVDYLQAQEQTEFGLYGIGCSEKNVYYLDKGVIGALVVPNEFNIGYLSAAAIAVSCASRYLRQKQKKSGFLRSQKIICMTRKIRKFYFLSCSDIQMGGRCKCVEQKKSGTC